MTTKLEKNIKREIEFKGIAYTVTLGPEGLKIVEKGKRKGQEMNWEELIGGSASLTANLQGSISRDETG